MRFKRILFFLLLFSFFKGFSTDTDTLQNQTYCIDDIHYVEFYYNRDDPSTKYQWQSNYGLGTVFTDLVNNVNFSGVDTNKLGISFVDATYDGWLLRCLVTISGVTDTSNIAVLYVRDAFFEELTDSMCLGGTYNWHDSIYTEAGTYYDSLQNIAGCDSVYKLNLSTYANYSYDTIVVCEGDSAFLQNAWQTVAGAYYDTVVYSGTCDTILQTEMLVEYKSQFTHTSVCDGDSVYLGGAWQTQAGLYVDNYVSANGCDITLRTHLSIKNAADSTIIKTICEGDSYYFNGQTYSTAGTYYHTEPSVNGCDSTVTLILGVTQLPPVNATATPSEIEEGETSQLFIENEGSVTWYSIDTTMSCTDCNNPVVSPSETTTYTVTMQIGFCQLTDSVTVTIKEPEFDVDIPEGFSPNKDGVNDAFIIKYLDEFPKNEIKILNRWGHKVFEARPYVNNWRGTNFFGISIGEDLPEGTYYYILQLHDKNNQIFKGYVYIKR